MDKLAQNSFKEPKSVLEGEVSKARAMTRSQRPQGSKKGASLSWLDGEVYLDKNILLGEQLKDPTCLDTQARLGKARDQKEMKLSHED